MLIFTLFQIAIISDDSDCIVEEVKRFSGCYDFVLTTGGIGPTHDDVTIEGEVADSYHMANNFVGHIFGKASKIKSYPNCLVFPRYTQGEVNEMHLENWASIQDQRQNSNQCR